MCCRILRSTTEIEFGGIHIMCVYLDEYREINE